MALFSPSELSGVLESANFKALTNDNFEILARLTAKREPTYVLGVANAVSGAPTTGAHVLDEFWRDQDGAEWVCTVAGTPGTWVQITGAVGASVPLFHTRVAKTSAYTVVGADAGKVFDCTSGTFDLTLTAAATLGNSFTFAVFNSGSGTVTINPNGAETIRDASGSAATNALTQGQGGIVVCDGAGFIFLKSGGVSTAIQAAIDAAVVGLFDLKGATDCSANPNYPAALKGDAYVVTVAGKIGGASGTVVSVGDVYFANADNAGGTEASVGTSWEVLEANIPGITAAGLAMVQAADADAQKALLGLSANDDLAAIEVILDGGGSALQTGETRFMLIPCSFTITEATLLSVETGDIEVEVQQCTYAQYDAGATHPVTGDKISASAPLEITAGYKSQDTTLTGWTTGLVAGRVLAFVVNSAVDITRCTVCLRGTKT